jgi:hypothetical protein
VNDGLATQLSWNKVSGQKLIIERSADNENYEMVETTDGSNSIWVDETALTGWNYYRVKDVDGTVLGEEVIYLTGKLDVTLVPNPAATVVTVGLENLPEATSGRYIVYNMKMKTVLQGEQQFEKGSNRFALDISTLDAGEYLVNLVINGMEVVEKLVVVK